MGKDQVSTPSVRHKQTWQLVDAQIVLHTYSITKTPLPKEQGKPHFCQQTSTAHGGWQKSQSHQKVPIQHASLTKPISHFPYPHAITASTLFFRQPQKHNVRVTQWQHAFRTRHQGFTPIAQSIFNQLLRSVFVTLRPLFELQASVWCMNPSPPLV